MASAPIPGVWSSLVQFTGNSVFVVAANGTIWLVSNTASSGAAIYRSSDSGQTFIPVSAIPGLNASSITFDPAVCIDAEGIVHFIGQCQTSAGICLQKYSFNPANYALTGPAVISGYATVGADYDIAPMTDGHTYVCASTITETTETVFGEELDAAGAIVFTNTIATQSIVQGLRLGSVSLLSVDGVTVEVYLGQHQKQLTYGDFQVTISSSSYLTGQAQTALVTMTQFMARAVDNRLTAVAVGTARYISQCFYSQQRLTLVANAILGYLPATGGAWVFGQFSGSPTAAITQPTLCVTASSVMVAYVEQDTTENPPQDGFIRVRNFNPASMTLTANPDFRLVARATTIYGTQSVLPANMPWGFIAQQFSTGSARFYTGFDAPPVVVLGPANLVAVRNTVYTFDASQSSSSSLDPLSFVWSLADPTHHALLTPSSTGLTASLFIPNDIGPAAAAIGVSVYVTSQAGTVTATSTVTLAAVAAPTIAAPTTLDAARNSAVTITPEITHAPGTQLSYVWAQTGGTPVKVTSSLTGPTLAISTAGASVLGETLSWTLTISDGINLPVITVFPVAVLAGGTGIQTEHGLLSRSFWSGNIEQRNTAGTWGASTSSAIRTTFFNAKRLMLANGFDVSVFIGALSVVVWGSNQTASQQIMRRIFLPSATDTVLDAVQTDSDYTIVLTSSGMLYRYDEAPLISTDSPTASIDLGTIDTAAYTHIAVTANFAGDCVVALSGPEGCLLLEIDNISFELSGSLHVNQATGLLYGGDAVQWLRMSNVESIVSGELLIGSEDANGNSFETLVSLSNRRIVGTWDASRLRNTSVVTGEVLFNTQDSYVGVPQAPVLSAPAIVENTVQLTWTQPRADLMTGYRLEVGVDGGASGPLQVVGSGSSFFFAYPLPASGHSYAYRIQARSPDGTSPWSNIVTLSL